MDKYNKEVSDSAEQKDSETLIHNVKDNNDEIGQNYEEKLQEEKQNENEDLSFNNIWPQVWIGCLANGLSLLTGINSGFSTVFIAKLMADPNIKEFSKTEASWIASLAVASGPVGACCIGPLMDRRGRKKAIMVANILPILSWAMTFCVTDSVWPLYIARLISGASAAMMASVGAYVSEISHPKVRDVMMVMIGAFISTGTLITMVLGSYLEWHLATLCFIIMSAVSFALSFLLPESPLWLVSFRPTQQRLDKALVLTRYFNRSEKLYQREEERMREIYAKMKKSESKLKKKCSIKKWFLKRVMLFKERKVYKPMTILIMVFFFWAFSGVFVTLTYTANIFQAIGSQFGGGFDEYTATIILGSVKLIMTIISAVASVKYGRKSLLVVSSLGMAITITTAAVLQTFSNSKLDFSKTAAKSAITESQLTPISLLTVMALVLYILFGSLAMTSLPWALVNELLPTRARALGNSIIASYSFLLMFTAIKSTPLLIELTSLSTLFFIFGFVSLISAVYIHIKVPETFGKNFQDIEKFFIKRGEK